jgi:aryl-alcohol dehydrogenase-like predicted oxidoreductase
MRAVRLGRTGLKVTPICLGTMTFGRQADEATAHAIMDRALDGGVTFFDSADVYPQGADETGRTEEIIGTWLPAHRQEIVLATKCVGRMGPGANDTGANRRHIVDAVHASLRRLRTDWIDLYQMHSFDPTTPLDETLRALDDLVRAGLVRYIGCSNYAAWQLGKALWTSDRLNIARFDSIQPRYNLIFREIEREMLPLCADQGVGVIVYNPLAGGLLTGKHPREEPLEGTRFALSDMYRERYWSERNHTAVARYGEIARRHDMNPVTFAVAWTLAHPAVTSAIVGASRPEQLDATLAAADVTLDRAVLDECDAVAAEMGYAFGPFQR